MGQKTHPLGFRLGVSENWRSRWFAGRKEYGKLSVEDFKIRKFLLKAAAAAGINKIDIERAADKVKVLLQVSRPGVVIGKGGASLNILKDGLNKETGRKVDLVIEEVRIPELSAKIMADEIVRQIKARMPLRRIMHSVVEKIMGRGALGVKIRCSGVISGPSSISRREKLGRGSVPGQTLRARIDFARSVAETSYGSIGVKVWIYVGEKGKEE